MKSFIKSESCIWLAIVMLFTFGTCARLAAIVIPKWETFMTKPTHPMILTTFIIFFLMGCFLTYVIIVDYKANKEFNR